MNINGEANSKYADMLYMERPVSTHPHMSMENRAGQFAPFAALNGFGGLIVETGRRTDRKIDISDEQMEKNNKVLAYVMQNESPKIIVRITYFEPDELKEGGKYVIKSGRIKSFNELTGVIRFADGVEVPVADISEVAIADVSETMIGEPSEEESSAINSVKPAKRVL